jgi:uncharacterized protein
VPESPFRLVLDTNVILRGLRDPDSAAGQLLIAVLERRMLAITNKPVQNEYSTVLERMSATTRFATLTPSFVKATLRRLAYVSDYIRGPLPHFAFSRDPRDEKFIELAIAGRATHVVSFDKDLLSLPTDHSDAGKRFRQRLPRIIVAEPVELIAR